MLDSSQQRGQLSGTHTGTCCRVCCKVCSSARCRISSVDRQLAVLICKCFPIDRLSNSCLTGKCWALVLIHTGYGVITYSAASCHAVSNRVGDQATHTLSCPCCAMFLTPCCVALCRAMLCCAVLCCRASAISRTLQSVQRVRQQRSRQLQHRSGECRSRRQVCAHARDTQCNGNKAADISEPVCNGCAWC